MTQDEALQVLKMGRSAFITGAPGSGKTYLLNRYLDWLRSHEMPVAVTASTGIAATHIGGMTIHAWSGVGARDSLSEWDIEELTEKQYLWKRFNNTSVLVIDEVSMVSAELLDSVEQLARAMRRNTKPFGGMQVIISGDFFQLPPVSKSNDASYAFDSAAWRLLNPSICYLDDSYRHDDETLEGLLMRMRDSTATEDDLTLLNEQKNVEIGIEPTKLYTHNVDVDAVNERKLESLTTPMKVFEMRTKGKKPKVESLQKSILAPEKLQLKEGALVMFVKNNFEMGYVNGTLGRVTEITNNRPIVTTADNRRVEVSYETWRIENDGGGVVAEVQQLPLRLAWAITVHKSQGMTLDAAEMDLSKCFATGQGYVALSRVRSLAGLSLIGLNGDALLVDPYVSQFDTKLRTISDKITERLAEYTEEEKTEEINNWITKAGGTLEAKKIPKKGEKKEDTYTRTLNLIKNEGTFEEIATKRNLRENTIIDHIEKLKERGDLSAKDLDHMLPSDEKFQSDLAAIRTAFATVEDKKLSPVRKKLNNRYTFDELRFARIFID